MSNISDQQVDETFGVLFIGFIISVTLYGWTFFQTYIFYSRYPNERITAKYTVGALWAIDTVTTALISHTMYDYLITNFTTPFDDLLLTKTFLTQKTLSGALVFIVQSYYAYRVYSLNDQKLALAILLIIIASSALALGIASAVEMSHQPLFVHIVTSKVKLLFGLSSGLALLCDVIIVTSQYYFLRPARKPSMKQPKGWLDIIILHVLSRGTTFTILQVVVLATFLALPSRFFWVLFHFLATKFYVNGLLAMFNSRDAVRGRGVHEEDSLSTKQSHSGNTPSGLSISVRGISRGIQIDTVGEGMKSERELAIELGKIPSSPSIGDHEAEISDFHVKRAKDEVDTDITQVVESNK